MKDDFKRGNSNKMAKVGVGWSFRNNTTVTVTVVAIEDNEYIVDLKNSEITVTRRYTYDELELFINSCKGLITITDNNWETCMPLLNIDNLNKENANMSLELIKEKESQIKILKQEVSKLKQKIECGVEVDKWYKKGDNTLFLKPFEISEAGVDCYGVWLDSEEVVHLEGSDYYSKELMASMNLIESSWEEMYEFACIRNKNMLVKLK